MRKQDIIHRLRERPFRPFRLHLTNGTIHEVRHSELVWVSPANVAIGLPAKDYLGPGDIMDYIVVSLLHVVQIEPVASFVQPPPDGE